MITIYHNFDETKFKWLWAKYVKGGNIEKHCTACMIGPYSKKFSGSSNKDLLSQPILEMDEVAEEDFEAIYFCGVLKQGYLNKNPLKNNYRHNVHFAVRPQAGAHDVWDFENWHVEIEDGVLEHIPETYELSEIFFHEPYNAHYYTCRIFRWMVGHFYPENIVPITYGLPETIREEYGKDETPTHELISELIDAGKHYVEQFFEEECWGYFQSESEMHSCIKNNVINRMDLAKYISENMGGGCGPLVIELNSSLAYEEGLPEDKMVKYIEIGIEEELDMLFPYKERNLPHLSRFRK